MSILDHQIWPILQPFVRIETYDRDGGHASPRHRIEVETPPDGDLLRAFIAVRMPCVVCGRMINPIRLREGGESIKLYFAATCELALTYACARSGAARDEYEAVVSAMAGWTDPRQPRMF